MDRTFVYLAGYTSSQRTIMTTKHTSVSHSIPYVIRIIVLYPIHSVILFKHMSMKISWRYRYETVPVVLIVPVLPRFTDQTNGELISSQETRQRNCASADLTDKSSTYAQHPLPSTWKGLVGSCPTLSVNYIQSFAMIGVRSLHKIFYLPW